MLVYYLYRLGFLAIWVLILVACIVSLLRRRTAMGALQVVGAGLCVLSIVVGIAVNMMSGRLFTRGDLGEISWKLMRAWNHVGSVLSIVGGALFAVGLLLERLRSGKEAPVRLQPVQPYQQYPPTLGPPGA